MSKQTIGFVLIEARIKDCLTQKDLTEKVGIHPNIYAKIEHEVQESTFGLFRFLKLKIEDIPS